MNIFTAIKEAIRRMIPHSDISGAAGVESPVSSVMQKALSDWKNIYQASPPWKSDTVKTMNLPAYICAEIARQILLECKWSITGTDANPNAGETVSNPRAEYLSEQFQSLMDALRPKLEIGCAAGGLVVKPYPKGGRLYFDFCFDWDLYPIAFDAAGQLYDAIFPDRFQRGKTYYTRLERHRIDGENVVITNRAFRSNNPDALGSECALSEVPQWANLEPEATAAMTGGMLFGWFKTANANSVDLSCPMGAAVFDKAIDLLKEADAKLYSGLLWEYESGERAVHVDENAMRPATRTIAGLNGPVKVPVDPRDRLAHLNGRLYRKVPGVQKSDTTDLFEVFSPPFREASYISGLNQLLIRVEDLCGLSRGTLSDANTEARTATELKIIKQRSYATIADNQKALEKCLRDVIRAMDYYAALYELVPEEKTPEERKAAQGSYDVSFEWDDSIITDSQQQMSERLTLVSQGLMSAVEFRQWYFGETETQARAAVQAIKEESAQGIALPNLESGGEV